MLFKVSMEIELIGIHKTFGAVHANDDIHLQIPSGTIQGILGENGAGKSTLMKILSGYISADRGDILLNKIKVDIYSPADAIKFRVGMLHQDPLDFPPMKVIDNFIIGSQEKSWISNIFPDHQKIKGEFLLIQERLNFSLDPDAYVDSLTVGERQQLEISRMLWLGADVFILDEPTTGISAPQKVKLFETLKLLASEGKTVLFVSHKLEDVEELCSRIIVLRKGKVVGTQTPPYTTTDLIKLMFGKPVTKSTKLQFVSPNPVLEISGLSLEVNRLSIMDVNLVANQGEVIGLAGMEGSGQLEFLHACAGLIHPTAGSIKLNGVELRGKNYHNFLHQGVAFIPASRLEDGLIPGLTLTEHLSLVEKKSSVFIDQENARRSTVERILNFNIRGTPETKVEALSGGNQQRALLSLLKPDRSLILLEHPTRGLDVESSIYVWSILRDQCKKCTSIIFISSDLEEIIDYSDRILVFFAGRVSVPILAEGTSSEQLGELIGGKGWQDEKWG
jgi:general nucleoside transport system ATP-binding protein